MVGRTACSVLIAVSLAAAAVGARAADEQIPPRDASPLANRIGTATIRGRVVDEQTGRALRRVRITLHAPELGREGISASTDDGGFYELTELPAGRFALEAQRSGYLRLRYGQRRPLEPSRPLALEAAQVLERVNFALSPISVISGRITDEIGEPIEGVLVSAQRFVYRDNRRRLLADGVIARSDDEGEYRIVGLMGGTYLVNALTLEKWTVTAGGREETMAYAPTFFPGVADASAAARVVVGTGQYLANVDFALVPGRAATISGIAVDSGGSPLRTVFLTSTLAGTDASVLSAAGTSTVAPDGQFAIRGVPPGAYTLEATGEGESAVLPIAVDGVDVTNIRLATSAGWSVRGNVVFDSDAAARPRRNQIAVSPVSFSGHGHGEPRERRDDDWTFSVTGIVGAARLRVTVPDGWAVRAMLQGNRDIADLPLELPGGEELSATQVVVTDRVATMTGSVLDRNGVAGPDGTVLLFPADTARWYEGSRFVHVARPDQRGEYRISGILPGEYLVVALDYVEDGIWNDPEYLESIRRDARRVVLDDPVSVSLPLTVVAP